jgi:ribosomal protein L21E
MRLSDIKIGQRVTINGSGDLMVLHPDKLHIGETGVVIRITKAGKALVRTSVGECTFLAKNLDQSQ